MRLLRRRPSSSLCVALTPGPSAPVLAFPVRVPPALRWACCSSTCSPEPCVAPPAKPTRDFLRRSSPLQSVRTDHDQPLSRSALLILSLVHLRPSCRAAASCCLSTSCKAPEPPMPHAVPEPAAPLSPRSAVALACSSATAAPVRPHDPRRLDAAGDGSPWLPRARVPAPPPPWGSVSQHRPNQGCT